MSDKVSTGIQKLDDLMGGGYPTSSIILLAGGPGTCKSIMSMQFAVNGIKDNKKALYISLDTDRRMLITQSNEFGWDLEKHEKGKHFKMLNYDMSNTHVMDVIEDIDKEIINYDPDYVVIDSLSILTMYAEVAAGMEVMHNVGASHPGEVHLSKDTISRGAIVGIITKLKRFRQTVLIIAESPEGDEHLSRDTFSEFLSDGVIEMSKDHNTDKRHLKIVKMRSIKHTLKPIEFVVSSKGIKLK